MAHPMAGGGAAVMASVPEDLPLNEVEQLIAEGEARRAEQLLVLQTQSRPD